MLLLFSYLVLEAKEQKPKTTFVSERERETGMSERALEAVFIVRKEVTKKGCVEARRLSKWKERGRNAGVLAGDLTWFPKK